MIQTKYGSFDGNSWEHLCQLVFKSKYKDFQYQEMVASPGDFGIEGFTKKGGIAFQCYCPDNHYTQTELYNKQRDKITVDLNKLRKYEKEIKCRLGKTRLTEWVFVTPETTDNKLLKHAQSKQDEVLDWNLSIIDSDFKVIIQDADFFAKEISEIQIAKGNKITLFSALDLVIETKEKDVSEYEKNIIRKNKVRCTFEGKLDEIKHAKLNKMTSDKWLESDSFLKNIEINASDIYFELMRVIGQYEKEVEELCVTWHGDAGELISRIKGELSLRLNDAIPSLGIPEQHRISDLIISKWLALCPLDIE